MVKTNFMIYNNGRGLSFRLGNIKMNIGSDRDGERRQIPHIVHRTLVRISLIIFFLLFRIENHNLFIAKQAIKTKRGDQQT